MLLLFALGVASSARADVPPPDPPPAASGDAPTAGPPAQTGTASTGLFRGHARRPIFLGLLAAAFLLIGALAGANDRPDGKAPPPRV